MPLSRLAPVPFDNAVVKILDVGAQEEGREVCVVGTLYKDMKLKPSILDEYTKVGQQG